MNGLYGTATVSTGITFASAIEWAKDPENLAAAATLAGSVASAALSWYLARRAEFRRARLEEERERRELEREQKRRDDDAARAKRLDDALTAIRIHQLQAGGAAAP